MGQQWFATSAIDTCSQLAVSRAHGIESQHGALLALSHVLKAIYTCGNVKVEQDVLVSSGLCTFITMRAPARE